MIVKGRARSGPAQLAAYLMRESENPTLLEIQHYNEDVHNALVLWDTIGEVSRADKRLLHYQICPEARYIMTPEEFLRAGEILTEKLGLEGHRRLIVLHEDGENPHAHVVFERVNSETGKAWDDSFNYVKHEAASLAMAQEFGHEVIPGKHVKRNRHKQPEFPRAELTEDQAQQEKRTGVSIEERKAEVTALYEAADNGPAFRAALEDAGYLLASGKRGYIVVDEAGGASALTGNVGRKKDEIDAFMAALPLDQLPSVEDAQAAQKNKQQTAVEEKGQGTEASKFLPSEIPSPETAMPAAPKKAAEREAEIAALHEAADSGQALKAALEDAGYVLAKGNRGYMVVDQAGGHSTLARNIDLKKKEVDAYMAAVPLDQLPTIEEAQALQKQRQASPAERGLGKGVEASKFAPPDVAPKPAGPPAALPPLEEKPSQEQPGKRAPIDPARRDEITALKAFADGAEDFKKSLENAGYTLAAGKGGYSLVDEEGKVFNLFAHIRENNLKLEAFMSPIPLSSLPTVEQVWEKQQKGEVKEPPPPIADTPAGWAPKDQELYDLERAILKRQQEDTQKLNELHEQQIRAKEVEMDRDIAQRMADYKVIEDDVIQAFKDTRKQDRTGIQRVLDAIERKLNPTLAGEKAQAREKEARDFYRRVAIERKGYEILLQQTKQEQIEALHERQAYERVQRERLNAESRDRHIEEFKEARRVKAELEAKRIHEEIEKNQKMKDGPPPPEKGK